MNTCTEVSLSEFYFSGDELTCLYRVSHVLRWLAADGQTGTEYRCATDVTLWLSTHKVRLIDS